MKPAPILHETGVGWNRPQTSMNPALNRHLWLWWQKAACPCVCTTCCEYVHWIGFVHFFSPNIDPFHVWFLILSTTQRKTEIQVALKCDYLEEKHCYCSKEWLVLMSCWFNMELMLFWCWFHANFILYTHLVWNLHESGVKPGLAKWCVGQQNLAGFMLGSTHAGSKYKLTHDSCWFNLGFMLDSYMPLLEIQMTSGLALMLVWC